MNAPRHVAIIMDGNGRWAHKRGLPRIAGHKSGLESVRLAIKFCVTRKIEVLTLFAFSTENWDRPKDEVSYLVENLFIKALEEELADLHKNGIQLQAIGELHRFGPKMQQRILEAQELTANNSRLKVVIALSYSGRWDIAEAARKLCFDVESGRIKAKDVGINDIAKRICLHELPEPDLLIRTSGEQRISNFMLWQLAYTELYFTEVLWPDFSDKEFELALKTYNDRERRFGKC